MSPHEWLITAVSVSGGGCISYLVWLGTRAYESWAAFKDMPYNLSGKWYSVEYDTKGELNRDQRNTFTLVKGRHHLGGKVSFRVKKQLFPTDNKPPTKWLAQGKLLHGDTLVGSWHSTVEQTKRFGSAIIKFTDYGRAAGYWAGSSGKDHPLYGYWIMARTEDDARCLAEHVLHNLKFECLDVVGLVLNYSTTHPGKTEARMNRLRDLRWTPETGQVGSLTQNQENDPHVEEKKAA